MSRPQCSQKRSSRMKRVKKVHDCLFAAHFQPHLTKKCSSFILELSIEHQPFIPLKAVVWIRQVENWKCTNLDWVIPKNPLSTIFYVACCIFTHYSIGKRMGRRGRNRHHLQCDGLDKYHCENMSFNGCQWSVGRNKCKKGISIFTSIFGCESSPNKS